MIYKVLKACYSANASANAPQVLAVSSPPFRGERTNKLTQGVA